MLLDFVVLADFQLVNTMPDLWFEASFEAWTARESGTLYSVFEFKISALIVLGAAGLARCHLESNHGPS